MDCTRGRQVADVLARSSLRLYHCLCAILSARTNMQTTPLQCWHVSSTVSVLGCKLEVALNLSVTGQAWRLIQCPLLWVQALIHNKFSSSSDVWSFGILMYEIWSWEGSRFLGWRIWMWAAFVYTLCVSVRMFMYAKVCPCMIWLAMDTVCLYTARSCATSSREGLALNPSHPTAPNQSTRSWCSAGECAVRNNLVSLPFE